MLGSARVFLGWFGGAFKAFRKALGLVCCVLDAQVAEEDCGLERDTSWPSARPAG